MTPKAMTNIKRVFILTTFLPSLQTTFARLLIRCQVGAKQFIIAKKATLRRPGHFLKKLTAAAVEEAGMGRLTCSLRRNR